MCVPNHDNILAEQDEDHSPAPSIAELKIQLSGDRLESIRLQDLQKYSKQDDEYQQQLKEIIWKGFSDHRGELLDSCKRYTTV